MRCGRFAVLWLLLAASVRGEDGPLTGQFAGPLAEALAAIQMTPADLTFRTDYVERDSFRLALVDDAFRRPLGTLDRVWEMSGALKTVDSPADLVILAASWLDLDERGSFHQKTPGAATFPDSLWFGAGSDPMLPAVRSAASLVFETFAEFLPEELDSLAAWAQTVMQQEEQEPGAQADIFALRREEHSERERARRYLSLAAHVNRAKLLAAAQEVFIAARRTSVRLRAMSPGARDTISSQTWDTPLGRVAIGGTGDDCYHGSYALIIDYGGNDFYDIARPDGTLDCPVQVIIDLSGDDRYEGCVASGVFGVGLLMDLAGNDTYRGESETQGAGIFGVGVLWDESGDDTYRAASASQGVGSFGVGALVDLSGRDVYQIGGFGQGLGATAGVGIVEDRAGCDVYLSGGATTDLLRYDDHYLSMAQGVGLGIRPVGSGGIGILSDRAGNDTYVADIFGQGVAYWLGVGGLVDEKGHDRYVGHQYAQGCGVHLAAGVLIDREGDDLYFSNSVSQGCGHDLSLGVLFDGSGDDNYVTEGLSLGAGNANGISLLVDMSGRDGYIARRPDVMGYSDDRREYGMVGIMLDLGGEDRYGAPFGADDTWWVHSTYGVGVDLASEETPASSRQPDTGTSKTPEEAAHELAQDPDSLFVQASNPVAAFQYLVEPAEGKLVERGGALTPFWAGKLGTESARERHALIRIHQKLFAPQDTADVPMLLDSTRSSCAQVRRMGAYLLGFSRATTPVPPLMDLLSHPDWQTRVAAAESLWRLKDVRAEPVLIATLADTVALVRHAAALALEGAGTSRSDTALARALSDPSQIVRHSAERALAAHPTSTPLLADIILADTGFAALHALRAVRSHPADSASVFPALLYALSDSLPWRIRAEAATTAEAWKAGRLLPTLVKARERADHPYLIQRLDSAIAAIRSSEAAGER